VWELIFGCQGTMQAVLADQTPGVNTVLQHWHFLILDPAATFTTGCTCILLQKL
jgi:hypothetical protein